MAISRNLLSPKSGLICVTVLYLFFVVHLVNHFDITANKLLFRNSTFPYRNLKPDRSKGPRRDISLNDTLSKTMALNRIVSDTSHIDFSYQNGKVLQEPQTPLTENWPTNYRSSSKPQLKSMDHPISASNDETIPNVRKDQKLSSESWLNDNSSKPQQKSVDTPLKTSNYETVPNVRKAQALFSED